MFFLPLPYIILEILAFTTWLHFYDFWDVFLIYIAPSFLGLMLFSMTGKSLMTSLQGGFQQQPGQLPGDGVLQKGAVLLGSLGLIIPLFFTRIVAVFLIVPGLRHLSIFVFKTYIFKRLSKNAFSFVKYERHGPRQERDAEVVNVTPIEITHTKIKTEE
jgi:UPF0716 protein FxsA